LPLLGLAELAAHFACARRPPAIVGKAGEAGDHSQDGWAAIVEPVRALRQPGDLIVVAPRWAEPLARQQLGDELMPIADLARPDISRYGTAVEISILDERDAALSGWREVERREHGPWVLRRLTNPQPSTVVVDFVDRVAPDLLSVAIGPASAPCGYRADAPLRAGGLGGHPTFPRQRFQCPGGSFFNVGVTVIADQDFRPRRCIWAHPPRRGALHLSFPDVPLGNVIAGHGGMYWIVERERRGAPVELEVIVDGEPVGTAVHHDGDGWAGFEIALGAHAGAEAADVQFAVRSADHRHRHYCFEAHSR
jgi:hypothetical protein